VADRATLVLVRAMAYDRALAERASAPLRVGVVHGAERGHRRTADAVMQTLQGLQGVEVSGLPLGEPSAIEWSEASDDTAALQGLGAVVLAAGVSEQATRAIAAFCDEHDVLLLSVDAAGVDWGAAVGVQVRSGHALGLVVSRAAAGSQGARMSGELLSMADVR
jgi:hypothetical protein